MTPEQPMPGEQPLDAEPVPATEPDDEGHEGWARGDQPAEPQPEAAPDEADE